MRELRNLKTGKVVIEIDGEFYEEIKTVALPTGAAAQPGDIDAAITALTARRPKDKKRMQTYKRAIMNFLRYGGEYQFTYIRQGAAIKTKTPEARSLYTALRSLVSGGAVECKQVPGKEAFFKATEWGLDVMGMGKQNG